MPTRLIDESLCTSRSLSQCSPKAQDAFVRLLLYADGFGCFEVDPIVMRGRLWPLRRDITPATIQGFLQEYERAGMLQIWQYEGKTYGYFVNWAKFQRSWEGTRRKTPIPPKLETTRNEPQQGVTPRDAPLQPVTARNGPPSSISSSSVVVRVRDQKSDRSSADDPAFEHFWQSYPRKTHKQAARKAWRQLAPTPELVETLLAAIARQRQSAQWQESVRFIPHAATWLNGKRWEDELEVRGEDPKVAKLKQLMQKEV